MSMANTFEILAGGGLDDFAPKPKQESTSAAPRQASPRQLEQVSEMQGFAINNHPIQRKALKSGRVASKDRPQPMSLRLRIADWNKFSAFCERNELSVADGFAKLAELAEEL